MLESAVLGCYRSGRMLRSTFISGIDFYKGPEMVHAHANAIDLFLVFLNKILQMLDYTELMESSTKSYKTFVTTHSVTESVSPHTTTVLSSVFKSRSLHKLVLQKIWVKLKDHQCNVLLNTEMRECHFTPLHFALHQKL
jgi:hypothetical protein